MVVGAGVGDEVGPIVGLKVSPGLVGTMVLGPAVGSKLGDGVEPIVGLKVPPLAAGLVVGGSVFAAAAAATEVYVEPPIRTVTACCSIAAAIASAIVMVTLVPSRNVMTATIEPPLTLQWVSSTEHPPLQMVVNMLSRTSLTR